jgi:hypothetical protein
MISDLEGDGEQTYGLGGKGDGERKTEWKKGRKR